MHGRQVLFARIDPEVVEHVTEHFPRAALRLKKEYGLRGTSQLFEQVKEQRRLAHARGRNQGQESTAGFDSVEQRSQGLAVRRAEIEEARVWSDPERLFAQSVVF